MENKVRMDIGRWALRRYFSRKTGDVLIFFFFMCVTFLLPVRAICAEYQYPVCPYFLPHLFSYLYFETGFFAAVIYFFSDIPFMNEWEANRVMKLGRKRWALVHIGEIIISSYLLMLSFFVLTFLPLVGVMEIENDWGNLLYTLSAKGDFRVAFDVSYKILQQYTPVSAMIFCVILGGAVISLIGLLMFMVSLFLSRTVAIITATVVTGLPIFAENLANMNNQSWLWYVSPVSWLRLDYIEWDFGRGLPDMQYIALALVGMTLVCSVIIVIKAVHVNFQWNSEEV